MSTAPLTRLAGAVTDATVSGRLWLYSNHHCNLACAYCLTESAPRCRAASWPGRACSSSRNRPGA